MLGQEIGSSDKGFQTYWNSEGDFHIQHGDHLNVTIETTRLNAGP
jgi:hypothetical protein